MGTDRLRQQHQEWVANRLEPEQAAAGGEQRRFETYSGITVGSVYTPLDVEGRGWRFGQDMGFPGQYPYLRGDTAGMYRTVPPRIFAYSGCATAEQTNARFKYLISQGARELVIASDLPSQIGYDSDHPMARGEVGKIGCAVSSLADMETIFDGIPLEEVYVGAQTNANSVVMLAMIIAMAEKQGVARADMKVLIQNDVLKEYFSRGTQIFPARAGLKLSVDCMEFCARNRLGFMIPILYCGYHTREAGGSAVQEIAFTLANAAAYIEEFVGRGLCVDDLPPPRTLLVAGLDLFEEVAKYRAYRRMWARMLKERFGASAGKVMAMTFTCGSQASLFTAQQPHNNLVRGTIQALVEVLAGAKTTYIATMDEALSIPTEESATLALRTMQIVHNECGIQNTVDPMGGSYYLEALTDELERKAWELCGEIDRLGGAVAAIEKGFQVDELAREAYRQTRLVDSGARMVVGVNAFETGEQVPIEVSRVDPAEEARQIARIEALRAGRDGARVRSVLERVRAAAQANANTMEPVIEAVHAYASMGEICDVLRQVYGEYRAF